MYQFSMKVYGCQMNAYDADKIRTALIQQGNAEIEDDLADVIVFVGCSIRDKAEHKVWSMLGKYAERWNLQRKPMVCITGCIAQNVGEEMLKRYPWVRVISGPRHIGSLPKGIDQALITGQRLSLLDDDPREFDDLQVIPVVRQSKFKAQVTIAHGCDNFCTYCIVPYVRGRFVSRKPQEIIDEVKALVDDGVKEIALLGQNVDSYGTDFKDGYNFATLLRDVAAIEGVQWLRFMTSYPSDFTDEVIDAIASNPNICPAINLPIQSGSDKILKAMNRRYGLDQYMKLAQKIRSRLPEVSLTSDLIVGFPGETDEDFNDTMESLKKLRFDMIHTAAYSPRQGTPAAKMTNQVPKEVKMQRLAEVNDLQTEVAREINQNSIGSTLKVLVDGLAVKGKGLLQGRTNTDKVVLFCGDPSLAGQFVNVKIDSAESWSLKGQLAD